MSDRKSAYLLGGGPHGIASARDRSVGRLPESLRAYLDLYMRRSRVVYLLRQIGVAATFVLAWLLCCCILDRLITLDAASRLALLITATVAASAIVAKPLIHILRRRPNWIAAAGAIERRNPELGQRLETVVTQAFLPDESRGSAAMLARMTDQIVPQMDPRNVAVLLPWRRAAFPWTALLAMIAVVIGLTPMPWLDLPRLMKRAVIPLTATAPATTTQITVEPGSVNIVEGQSATITARAVRLTDQAVRIHLSNDGQSFIAATMTPLDGKFTYIIASVDRDFFYYITGGDAVTPTYTVRAMQPPAVKEFQVTYTYPAYTQRPPLKVSNLDGLIEAPTGSKAVVSVIANQSLKQATLAAGNSVVSLDPTSEPNVRQATLPIDRDDRFDLKLLSTLDVEGKFAGTVKVRAIADRPPLARLLQPGQDLRLHPREILPLAYRALDDFGVVRLAIEIQVNAKTVTEMLIPARGDPRRQEGNVELDLAPLKLNIGDVVSLMLVAVDGAGHKSVSEMRHILVSPRSIDLNSHLRLSALKEAAALSSTMSAELQEMTKIADQVAAPNTHPTDSAVSPLYQRLVGVSETSLLLRRSLLAAAIHSDTPELSLTVANLLDTNAMVGGLADQLSLRLTVDVANLQNVRKQSQVCLEKSQQAAAQLVTLSQAEQAAALVADRANLRTTETSAKAEPAGIQRLHETIARARADMTSAAADLALNPEAPDIDLQLQQKIELARTLQRSQKAIDLVEIARRWGQMDASSSKIPQPDAILIRRLEAASAAEAIRPEPDLIYARDLQLSCRAARMIEVSPAFTTNDAAQSHASISLKQQFAPALAALIQEHDARSRAAEAAPTAAMKAIAVAAEESRLKMRRWAAEPDLLVAAAEAIERQRQSLVMEANAEMVRRNYERASLLDRKAADGVLAAAPQQNRPDPARQQLGATNNSMRAVERIDQLAGLQRRLADDTVIATTEQLPTLINRQRKVAEAIDQAQKENIAELGPGAGPPPDSGVRERSISAIERAQEQLARIPGNLDEARQAAEARRQSAQRLDQKQREIAAMAPDHQAAAKPALELAQKALAEAEARWLDSSKKAGLPAALAISQDLRQFAPEAGTAIQAIDQKLSPALESLTKAGVAGDSASIDAAAERARQALGGIQDELLKTQSDLVELDPLVAGKWFAQAAANALAQQIPDFSIARREQANASDALSRAWVNIVRQAAANRMAGTPVMAPLIGRTSETAGRPGLEGFRFLQPQGLHEWMQTSSAERTEFDPPHSENDPTGFQDALKAYFDALGNAGNPSGLH